MLQKTLHKTGIKSVFRDFAKRHDLLFIGAISDKDELEPIRGITYAPGRKDSNYAHGVVNKRDVTLIERSVSLKHPYHGHGVYEWAMLQVHVKLTLPHLVFLRHSHNELVKAHVFSSFQKLKAIDTSRLSETFTRHFSLFSTPEHVHSVQGFSPDFLEALVAYFPDFDVEVTSNSVLVYDDGEHSIEKLQKMLDEAVWLAEHLGR